jgi:hypothetical protein
MKSLAARILFSVSLALILAPAALAQNTQSAKTINNAAVVKLSKAGFKEKTIISIINARVPNFDLSAERMIELKRNGVSEKIIVAMLARQEGMDFFDDGTWGDDEFISKGLDPKSGNNAGNSAGNNSGGSSSDPGTNIFGSSGGSKGQSRSTMGNGGAENDVVTTGSATVRIIKPPTEAGGAESTKLEKTKSLTNESIVELVEAGFSEGTIIRRIEQSPVEFDLTASKLEELRKRRVSDRVVAAMKAAMGEDK